MTTVLVTGASGLLGSKIVQKAREKYSVCPTHAAYPFFPDSLKMDITNAKSVNHVLDKVKPNMVVHTAAQTNVDKCENDRDLAFKANAQGTRILAEKCDNIEAKMVYVSTDYVFDGEKGWYTEEDKPNPVNIYGLTKLLGERYVSEFCGSSAILRTSVLYGVHPKKQNFATWVIEALKKGKRFTVVTDHFNSPTFADNLAEVILEVIEKDLEGTYHAAGGERISRYAFALKIAEAFGFRSSLIEPVEMSELKAWTARRPKDSSLCIDEIKRKLDTKPLDVIRGVREMKRIWVEKM